MFWSCPLPWPGILSAKLMGRLAHSGVAGGETQSSLPVGWGKATVSGQGGHCGLENSGGMGHSTAHSPDAQARSVGGCAPRGLPAGMGLSGLQGWRLRVRCHCAAMTLRCHGKAWDLGCIGLAMASVPEAPERDGRSASLSEEGARGWMGP